MKAVSLNLRGLGDNVKRHQLFKVLKDKCVDIAMLQETHCCQECHSMWEREWGGKIYCSHGTSVT